MVSLGQGGSKSTIVLGGGGQHCGHSQECCNESSLSSTPGVCLGELERVLNLLSANQAEVESTATIILTVAGNILWLACRVEKRIRFIFVFALVRDKRLFCLLRWFGSFNCAFVLLGLGISF